ncbi:MAG TPA: WD40 repeat domain-containing protein [Gemmataceae bacterium]|nr:WD40 repeat domain-containing protein [Gemmataceae bacterium]
MQNPETARAPAGKNESEKPVAKDDAKLSVAIPVDKKWDVSALAVSADGKRFLAHLRTVSDTSIQLWNIPSRSLVKAIDPGPNGNGAIWLNTTIAVTSKKNIGCYHHGGFGGSLVLLDLTTGKEFRRITGTDDRPITDFIPNIHFSSDGDRLVYTTSGHIVGVDTATGKERFDLTHKDGYAFTSGLFDGSSKLVSVSRDALKSWDLKSGKISKTIEAKGIQAERTTVAVSDDGKFVASGGELDPLVIWDLGKGKSLREVAFKGSSAPKLFLPGSHILAYGNQKEIDLVDVETGERLHSVKCPADANIKALAVTPDGSTLISGGSGGLVLVWNLKALQAGSAGK